MKPTRLIEILYRTSRGLSTIIDARMLRDELADVYGLAIQLGAPPKLTEELQEKLTALGEVKL